MAEAEIAQRTKQVQELTEKLIAAEQKALKAVKKQTTPKPPSTTQESQKIVVLPRERGLKRFIGRRTDSEQPVEDFIENLKAAMLAIEMTPGEKLDLIKSHLEGQAREELRLFAKDDSENPNCLQEIFLEAFGEKRSLLQILKLFYDRR